MPSYLINSTTIWGKNDGEGGINLIGLRIARSSFRFIGFGPSDYSLFPNLKKCVCEKVLSNIEIIFSIFWGFEKEREMVTTLSNKEFICRKTYVSVKSHRTIDPSSYLVHFQRPFILWLFFIAMQVGVNNITNFWMFIAYVNNIMFKWFKMMDESAVNKFNVFPY